MAQPKKQRSYPRVINIKDPDIKETIRLLWDAVHDTNETFTTLDTANTSRDATIAQLQAQNAKLNSQLTQALAGGGISTPSSVGGGGSGGTSGGSGSGTPGGGGGTPGGGNGGGPNGSSHPNHAAEVAQAKADLIAAGIDISGDCGAFEIVKLVAWRLKVNEPDIGLVSKPSGTNCNGYNTSNIMYQNDGVLFDILQDAGGLNGPQWNFNGTLPTTSWSPPITPAIP